MIAFTTFPTVPGIIKCRKAYIWYRDQRFRFTHCLNVNILRANSSVGEISLRIYRMFNLGVIMINTQTPVTNSNVEVLSSILGCQLFRESFAMLILSIQTGHRYRKLLDDLIAVLLIFLVWLMLMSGDLMAFGSRSANFCRTVGSQTYQSSLQLPFFVST